MTTSNPTPTTDELRSMIAAGTMTQAIWSSLSPSRRNEVRDLSSLTPELIGREGYRVEVTDALSDEMGKPWRRFIVGMSTGWRPCHLEISRRGAMGGSPARKAYRTLRLIEYVRD